MIMIGLNLVKMKKNTSKHLFIKITRNDIHNAIALKYLFFTGDIVEILALTQRQIYDIESQTCRNLINPNTTIVGSRYRVAVYISNHSYDDVVLPNEVNHFLIGWKNGGHNAKYFKPESLWLIHRPFKNRLKFIIMKITRRYKPEPINLNTFAF